MSDAFGSGWDSWDDGFGAAARPRRRRQEKDPFENQSLAKLLEQAGATEEEIRRALLEERVVGPTGIQATSAGLGIELDDPEKRTFLEAFFDVATRPQAAVTGFVTGLAGMERQRVTEDEGVMLEPEGVSGGFGLALERAKQGITGEEKFRAADFGALAYDREQAGAWERALKSGAGFVLDVALDPVTYLSLGGSMFGRVRGASRAYASLTASQSAARKTMVETIAKDSVDDQIRLIQQAPAKFGFTDSRLADVARQRGLLIPEGSSFDDAVKQLRNIATPGTVGYNPQLVTEIAADSVAAMGAAAYRGGSSAGLMALLSSELGDAGKTIFRNLPLDMQGGVRMRVPFSAMGGRDPKLLFRIPGTEQLSSLSNMGRDILRNNVPIFRSLGRVGAGRYGAEDKLLASAIFRSSSNTSRKVWGQIDPNTNTLGWLDVKDLEAVVTSNTREMTKFIREAAGVYTQGARHLDEARRIAKASGQDPEKSVNEMFDVALNARIATISDKRTQGQVIEEVFGPNPTAQQIEVFEAAGKMQTSLEMYALRAEEVFQDPKVLFERLGPQGEYWPRMVEEMNKTLGGRGKSARLMDRNRFFSVLNLEGDVVQWMTPNQIARIYGEEIFTISPEKAMMAYMDAMNTVVQEEMLFRELGKRSLVFRGAQNLMPDIDSARRAGVRALSSLEDARVRVAEIGTPRTPKEANEFYEAVQGWRQYGAKIYDTYVPALREPPAGVVSEIVSPDNIRIQTLAGPVPTFRVVDRRGKVLTSKGAWADDVSAAQVFPRSQDAEFVADEVMRDARRARYIGDTQKLVEQFELETAADLRTLKHLDPAGNLTELSNPLHPANIPLAKQEEYISQLVEIMSKYGQKAGYRSRAIVGDAYKQSGSNYGLVSQATVESPQMRPYFEKRFADNDLFAPEGLIDPIRRLYKIRQTPEGFKMWVNDFYLPFYSMQKSLMTAQRGPGYVVRNIMGGVWNAYLFGVGVREWKLSSTVNIAKNQSVARAKRLGKGLSEVDQGLIAEEEFRKILLSKLGDSAGSQMFDIYRAFDNMGLGGRTRTSRTVGTQANVTALGTDISLPNLALVDQGKYKNVVDWLASRNRWARIMGGAAQESEDYLRFASFLRGVKDFGLEDGGYAASLHVKASQFDYTDLSDFEAETIKMILPFYTWARNNIPLQFRAMISEPGKVNEALRINDALRDAFGEPDVEGEPLPSFARERLRWRVRSDMITGPAGDAIAAGMLAGEPLVDIAALFRDPSQVDNALGVINWREAFNSVNPVVDLVSTFIRGVELSTGGTLPQTEPAPPWAEALRIGTVNADGERVVSSRALRAARTAFAPFGTVQRLVPGAGGERYARRVYTSWASTLFGLPVSTLDPVQTAAELRTRDVRARAQLEKELGENYSTYTGFVRALIEKDATPEEMLYVKREVLGLSDGERISDLPVERLDLFAARDTIDFLRRMDRLAAIGLREEQLKFIWDNFTPRTDVEMGVRAGQVRSLSREELASLGLTPYLVEQLSEEELLRLLRSMRG